MKSLIRLGAAAFALSVVSACTCGPSTTDRCASVTCPTGQLCDPNDGVCKGDGTGGGDAGIPGDTCGDAIDLTLTSQPDGGQSTTFQADTTTAVNNYQGSCGGLSKDLVYHLTLTSTKTVTLTIQADAGSDPVA